MAGCGDPTLCLMLPPGVVIQEKDFSSNSQGQLKPRGPQRRMVPILTLVVLTLAAFIRVVGSEFVQKYLGEGPRMVRDVFRLAKENAPAIIFIDEIDAIATKRFDAQTGGE